MYNRDIGAEDRSILFQYILILWFWNGSGTDTGVHDGGRYSCEIETDSAEPLAVVHIVEILGKRNTVTQIILEVAGTTYKLSVFLSPIVLDDCDPKPREIAWCFFNIVNTLGFPEVAHYVTLYIFANNTW